MKDAKAEALRWYNQALDDLEFVRWLLKEGRFFDKGCFIAQQAAEKALKASLYATGKRVVLGHSTYDLTKELSKIDKGFEKLLNECKLLDRYYIPTRYPNGLPGGEPMSYFGADELKEGLDAAEKVFNAAVDFLTKKDVF